MKTVIAQYKDLTRWDVKSFLHLNIFTGKKLLSLSDILIQYKNDVVLEKERKYKLCGIHSYGKGLFHRDIKFSSEIKAKKLSKIKKNTFIYSRLGANNGSFDLVSDKFDGYFVSNEFPTFEINEKIIKPEYLKIIFLLEKIWEQIDGMLQGAAHKRFRENNFLSLKIPIPDIKTQQKIVDDFYKAKKQAEKLQSKADEKEKQIDEFLMRELGIEKIEQKKKNGAFVVNYKDLERWSVGYNLWSKQSQSKIFETINFDQKPQLVKFIQRGKSPKYSNDSDDIVLNQKCNRWNNIDISHAKNVDKEWLSSVDNQLFLQKNDIIINSTGEGTIGRASVLIQDGIGLFYDSHMLLLRLCEDEILPMFFVLIFNSDYGQSQVDLIKSAQSTKQTELGVDNLQKINFPLPPLKTQKTIVAKIEKMRAEVQKLRRQSTNILQSAKDNLQSVIIGK